jgi:hypothetical protein
MEYLRVKLRPLSYPKLRYFITNSKRRGKKAQRSLSAFRRDPHHTRALYLALIKGQQVLI